MKSENIREILEMIKDRKLSPQEGFQRIKKLRHDDQINCEYKRSQTLDIAIIGMSGRFPGAQNLDEFWNNLLEGKNLISETTRWDVERFYDPDPEAPGKSYSKWGGFLEGIDRFDPLFFNISPKEAELMDPQQRLFLEEAWKTLEDAGYSPHELEGVKCGVFVGYAPGEYHKIIEENGLLPEAFTLIGNNGSILASRISYFLNLKGPSIAVDTACSSSLVAVHLACESILSGTSDMAIAGGVSIGISAGTYIMASKAGMMSQDGQCKTFDNAADGFVPGEGVGGIVLKHLEAAIRDGDHIYGVISGSGINQDGRTNGITSPSLLSQAALEHEIYEKYKINPEAIGYMEAHGTGTRLGDPIEVEALTQTFTRYSDKKQYCAIGSVKTNMGHTLAASGIAGLIKGLLCLKYKKIVPSINFERGNKHIDFIRSPFYVPTRTRDWKAEKGIPRQVAVNAFGFSGTNAHVVVREAQGVEIKTPAGNARPCYLFPLSAKTRVALKQKLEDLARWLEKNEEAYGKGDALSDISYTLLVGRSHFPFRLVILARNINELTQTVKAVMDKGQDKNYMTSAIVGTQLKQEASLREKGRLLIERLQRQELEVDVYKKDLLDLADLYVKGYDFDWRALYSGELCYRVSLPTYPFAQDRYWVPERAEPEEELSSQPCRHTDKVCEYDLLQKIQEDLVTEVAKLVKRKEAGIDLETSIDLLGFDSILFSRLVNLLNKKYKIFVLMPIFYQNPTIGELALYMEQDFGCILRKYYDGITGPKSNKEHPPVYDKVDIESWFDQVSGKEGQEWDEGEQAELEENDVEVMLLNQRTGKNIFAFPPLFGFGVAYLKLAILLDGFSFYSFDFLDRDDRIRAYADKITQIQQNGPYILLGYSDGGILALDTAVELLRRGHKISRLIVLDGPLVDTQIPLDKLFSFDLRHEDIIKIGGCIGSLVKLMVVKPIVSGYILNKNYLKDSAQFFEYWGRNVLKLKDKFVLYVAQGKIMSFIKYSANRKNPVEKIDVAIHLIKSNQLPDERVSMWAGLTKKELKTHQGNGTHLEMISPAWVAKNVEIIKKILYEIG